MPNPAARLLPVPRYLLRWVPIAGGAGILSGSASALLLWSLDLATRLREQHHWLIALLPLAGLSVGLLYHLSGRSVEAGNNLILNEIHRPQQTIPARMTPLILLGTFMTHLFGGSAGREGTALQMGASLADQLTRPLRLDLPQRRVVLMCGLSAGFGSVFGTPLAGTVFGIEVLAIGGVSYEALVPCLLASFVGDLVTRGWGIQHTVYRVTSTPPLTLSTLVWAALAGVVFGLAGMLFSQTTHAVGQLFQRRVAWPPLRPLVGGVLVAGAVFALGTTRYIGLGIPTIVASFSQPQPGYVWLVKLLFTAVTLGAGFKGGEVTPLFFIGATLGSALSFVLPLPSSLLAGMGFAAVFAGAANTPIAATLMAVELFGGEAGAFAGIACIVAYLVSGHTGIYGSQLLAQHKHQHEPNTPQLQPRAARE